MKKSRSASRNDGSSLAAGGKRTLRNRGHSRGRSAASIYGHAGVNPIEHRGQITQGSLVERFLDRYFSRP
jgi:hypothetical protein